MKKLRPKATSGSPCGRVPVGLIIGLIVVVGFCFVGPQTSSAQIEEKVPKGLKTKTITQYYFKDKIIMPTKRMLESKTIYKYDKKGQAIEMVYYNYDKPDELSFRQTSTFNKYGKLTESSHYNSKRVLVGRESYKYDEKGNLVEKTRGDIDKDWSCKITYKYDDKGNQTEENRYDEKGNIGLKVTSKYDKSGNKIEQQITHGKGNSLWIKSTCKYDKDGNLIESYKYKADGTLDERWVIRYNENGQDIETLIYHPDGNLNYKYISKYDKRGDRLEKIGYHSNKRPFEKSIFKYDKKNNPIKVNHYGITWVSKKDIETPTSETTYEYEFYPEAEKE